MCKNSWNTTNYFLKNPTPNTTSCTPHSFYQWLNFQVTPLCHPKFSKQHTIFHIFHSPVPSFFSPLLFNFLMLFWWHRLIQFPTPFLHSLSLSLSFSFSVFHISHITLSRLFKKLFLIHHFISTEFPRPHSFLLLSHYHFLPFISQVHILSINTREKKCILSYYNLSVIISKESKLALNFI